MSTKPESRRQRKIKKSLIKAFPNSFWIKIWSGPFQVSGFPDLLGCVEGRFFAFEVKMPGKPAKENQKRIMRLIKKAGGVTGVISEAKQAITLIQEAIPATEKSGKTMSIKRRKRPIL